MSSDPVCKCLSEGFVSLAKRHQTEKASDLTVTKSCLPSLPFVWTPVYPFTAVDYEHGDPKSWPTSIVGIPFLKYVLIKVSLVHDSSQCPAKMTQKRHQILLYLMYNLLYGEFCDPCLCKFELSKTLQQVVKLLSHSSPDLWDLPVWVNVFCVICLILYLLNMFSFSTLASSRQLFKKSSWCERDLLSVFLFYHKIDYYIYRARVEFLHFENCIYGVLLCKCPTSYILSVCCILYG